MVIPGSLLTGATLLTQAIIMNSGDEAGYQPAWIELTLSTGAFLLMTGTFVAICKKTSVLIGIFVMLVVAVLAGLTIPSS